MGVKRKDGEIGDGNELAKKPWMSCETVEQEGKEISFVKRQVVASV